MVKKVTLYSSYNYKTCRAKGSAAASFPTTVKAVYFQAQYSNWMGFHKEQDQWYAPNGKLWNRNTGAWKDSGSGVFCGYNPIRGYDTQDLPGIWTLRLLIDGHVVATSRFTLRKAKTGIM